MRNLPVLIFFFCFLIITEFSEFTSAASSKRGASLLPEYAATLRELSQEFAVLWWPAAQHVFFPEESPSAPLQFFETPTIMRSPVLLSVLMADTAGLVEDFLKPERANPEPNRTQKGFAAWVASTQILPALNNSLLIVRLAEENRIVAPGVDRKKLLQAKIALAAYFHELARFIALGSDELYPEHLNNHTNRNEWAEVHNFFEREDAKVKNWIYFFLLTDQTGSLTYQEPYLANFEKLLELAQDPSADHRISRIALLKLIQMGDYLTEDRKPMAEKLAQAAKQIAENLSFSWSQRAYAIYVLAKTLDYLPVVDRAVALKDDLLLGSEESLPTISGKKLSLEDNLAINLLEEARRHLSGKDPKAPVLIGVQFPGGSLLRNIGAPRCGEALGVKPRVDRPKTKQLPS